MPSSNVRVMGCMLQLFRCLGKVAMGRTVICTVEQAIATGALLCEHTCRASPSILTDMLIS